MAVELIPAPMVRPRDANAHSFGQKYPATADAQNNVLRKFGRFRRRAGGRRLLLMMRNGDLFDPRGSEVVRLCSVEKKKN